jgi:hypothetical protein
MRFKFMQVLFRKEKASVPNSLDGMTCSSSFDNQTPTSSGLSDLQTTVKDISIYDDFVTSVAIISSNENEEDQDDYGFFADFEDENSLRHESQCISLQRLASRELHEQFVHVGGDGRRGGLTVHTGEPFLLHIY